MNIKKQRTPMRGRRAGVGMIGVLAAGMLAVGMNGADAADFEFQGAKGFFDTTVSTGITFRVQGDGTPRSTGDANFNAGNPVSQVTKATHDFNIERDNIGAFVRGTYFYDSVIENKSGLAQSTRDAAGYDASLLDYFVYGNWDIGDSSRLHLRLGSQVVSWGESTFFTNSINAINPQDVIKARAPGAEVKEILVPLPMAWAAVDITDNWSVEAFALLHWSETELDPVGTFFSTSDTLGRGATALVTPAGVVPRISDAQGENLGNFGVSTHVIVEDLGYTDFGFYYIKYNPYAPVLGLTPATTPGDATTMRYFADYSTDINLYGASFNTTVWKAAVQGEVSYQDNFPIQRGFGQFFGGNLNGTATATKRTLPISQAQVTSTYVFPPNVIPTTSQTSWVTEVAWTHVYDHTGEVDLGGVTSNAVAFRTLFGPQWDSAFVMPGLGSINLKGKIDYQMGVIGVGPAGGPPSRDAYQLTLGLEAIHLDKLSLGVNYTNMWGNKQSRSRYDYAGVDMKYSF